MTHPHHLTNRRILGATLAAGCLAAFLAATPAAQADRLPAPKMFAPYDGLESSLRGGAGHARVLIHLTAPPTVAVTTDANAALRRKLAGQPTHAELEALADASPAKRETVAAMIEERRHDALQRLQPAADDTIAAQAGVIDAIERVGGTVLERDTLTGSVTAEVPRPQLLGLQRRDDVAAITTAPVEVPLGLADSTHAVGAPSFWAAGFLGGRGANDTTGPDLALMGDRIYQRHPAFNGITFQTPDDASDLCPPTIVECAHGTQVAGVAFSQGVTGTGTASDADQKGIAPGIDTVLDADLKYWTPGTWLVGLDQWEHANGNPPQPGADDPAEIVNASYGSLPDSDDAPSARAYDYFATGFGITSTISAGNRGPATQSLSTPCIAYDSICVGAFGIWAPGDWRIEDFSSRGPTVGGRKKPDLVANGATTTTNPKWQSDGQLWAGVTGTSFAAPQAAGAATLLSASGITHHLAHKSVLINSARQGRKAPTDAMGTQTDWQPDWGWGALDLTAALGQRSAIVPSTPTTTGTAGNHAVAEIGEADVHFYSATTQAVGDRATLVWDRRAFGCLSIGCPEGSFAMTLTDLGLSEISVSGATIRDERPSSIDNVEQVRSPGAASVVYKVKALSAIDGATREPYSIAATRPLKRLVTPRPKVIVTSTRADTRPGEDVIITALITNPSPDLPANDVSATLDLPAGAELVSGSATRSLGTLATNASSTQTWAVRFTGDGAKMPRVAVTATALAEPLPASAGRTVVVDGTAPTPSIDAPSGTRFDTNLPVSWAASDGGVGVASYDVEASVNGHAFTPWQTATTGTSATYNGGVGFSYRFRSRSRDRLGNLSGWAVGPVTSVAHPPPPPSTTSAPAPPAMVRAAVRIRKATLARGKVAATGTLTPGATGRLTFRFVGRTAGRMRTVKMSVAVARSRWSKTLKLTGALRRTRSGRLTVSYTGDGRHSSATAVKTLRRSSR